MPKILSILFTKIMIFFMRLLGGGSSLPGEIILKLDKNILKKVSSSYKVILVTGTNGKTTTCSMLYNILKNDGYDVINNSSGANMTGGIITCFAAHYKFWNNTSKRIATRKLSDGSLTRGDGTHECVAVIEVDEAYAKHITALITPVIIIVTNIFRDQLDRYGEISTTYNLILDAIKNVPSSTLVLNGDEPLFGELETSNKCVYYGFNGYESNQTNLNAEAVFCKKCQTPYTYHSTTFNHLGDYSCPNCGYKRPDLDFSIGKDLVLNPEHSIVSINDQNVNIGIPGLYNIYNALAAYAAASFIGAKHEAVSDSLARQTSKFGRFETINIDNSILKMLLIKNPAGCNQCIDTVVLDAAPVDLMLMLNDNYGDGTDISWIYDSHFEALASMNYNNVIIGGTRAYDMAVRLKIAGLDPSKFIIADTYDELLNAIKASNHTIYAFVTYTAMTTFRKFLATKNYVDSNW